VTLKVGSKGPKVVEWQMFLKAQGYFKAGVAPVFGPKTYEATKRFQADQGLIADGIVGMNTEAAAKRLQNPKERLRDWEIARLAGIPTKVLKAIRHVESRGKPAAVRFEPHLFHRHRPDLADQVPYTRTNRGYSTTRSETGRSALEHAVSLDAETAIKSTSFGSYQVLGAYLLQAFPGNPNDALASFWESPQQASELMVAAWFQDNSRARKAANEEPPNMAALARAYNGPNYHVHKYDEQLQAAWENT
jgi:hypothetical protein